MTDFWIKKPEKIEDLAGNRVVKAQMEKCFVEGTTPHILLIVGESGYGKGCLTNIIRHQLGVLDINVSFVDCGVFSTVGETRKLATKLTQTPFGGESQKTLFILDEVHRITKSSQEALLASCENLKPWVYIIATTNKPNELLNSFRSRFMEIKLTPLTENEMLNELFRPVIIEHDIKVRRSTLQEIYKRCNGNNRNALSMLQSISTIDPAEHMAVLGECMQEDEAQPLYKAINIIFTYDFTDMLSAYSACMEVFTTCGLDAEAIRVILMKECSKRLCSPKSLEGVTRASYLTSVLYNVTCYGAEGWAVLGASLYQYLSNFFPKI